MVLKRYLSFLLILISVTAMGQRPYKSPKTNQEFIAVVKYYRYLSPDSALLFVTEGLKLATSQKDDIGKAALLNQYGMIEDNLTRYQEAKAKYSEAELIYRKENDSVGLASTLIRIAVVEKRKGNYDRALASCMEALELNTARNNKVGRLESYVVLAEIYHELGKYDESLQNLKIAERIDREIPISSFTLNMYITYGYLYLKLQDYDKVIYYSREGLFKASKVEFNGSKISLLKILALAYSKKGEKDKAISIFKEALTFSRKIKNVLREQSTLVELSEVYEDHNPDEALFYLNQALSLVTKYKIYRQQINVLNKMSLLYKRKGNLAKALDFREQSNDLAEEVFYKDMMRQVVSLETASDLEKSKAKLNELTLKNKAEQLQKNIFLAIALGTVIILAITLFYYFKSTDLNKKLKKANNELADGNNVKDKFISIIAHDIRSPLVSTIGILNLIDDKDIDTVSQDLMVKKLIAHCDNSLSVLDKLLKWGQMQIKGIRIEPKIFNPVANINRNLALAQAVAAKKNISINVDIPEGLTVNADCDHFDFVIRNLISNAVKFTDLNGRIEVKAREHVAGKVLFSVSDNGVGIAENKIKNLFTLSTVSTKGTAAEEGTSLGLVICKEFIEANSGEIFVTSQVNKGTVFSFTLNGNIK